MRIVLLLFTCIIIIIVCFIVLLFIRKSKEHFMDLETPSDLVSLRTDFAPETCDVLQSFDLDQNNLEIQNTYLSANRIRKLKKEGHNESNSCYIDDDPKNGIQDYVMKNASCDFNNGMFQNVPFITDVYSDDKKDRSRNFPVNKCVFNIDPTKINTNSLNAFWSNLTDLECQQQSMALSNDIQSYIDQVSQCHGYLYLEDDTLRTLQNQINDKNIVTQELENTKYNLQQTVQKLLDNINELADDAKRLNDKINQMQGSLETCLKDKSMNKSDWKSKYAKLKSDYATLMERLTLLQQEFNRLTIDLQDCNKKLAKINKQIATWQQEYKLMQPAFQIIIHNLKVSQDKLLQIQKDLASCNIKKTSCEKEMDKVDGEIIGLQSIFIKCNNDLNVCKPNLNICQVAEDDIHIKAAICSSDKDDCLRSVTALQVMRDEQQNEIDYLLSLLKTCDAVKDQNNELMATIQTLTLKQELTTNDVSKVIDQINQTKQIINDSIASAISSATPNFCANATAAADNASLQAKIAANQQQPTTKFKEWIALGGPFNIDNHNLGGAYHYDTVQDCQDACKSNADCTHLVFNTDNNSCQLKGPAGFDSVVHCGNSNAKAVDDPTLISFINLKRWGFSSISDCDYSSGHQHHCDSMFEGEVTKW